MATFPTEDWKRELIEIFFSRIRIIAGCTLAIFAGAVVIVLVWPRTYEASGSLLMRSKGTPVRADSLARERMEETLPVSKEDLATELEILTSVNLIENTVRKVAQESEGANVGPKKGQPSLNIVMTGSGLEPGDEAPTFLEEIQGKIAEFQTKAERSMSRPVSPFLAEVKALKKNLKAEVVPLSSVIKVTFRGKDSRRVETVLDALLKEYIVYRATVFNPNSQEQFFTERAKDYRDRVNTLESQSSDGNSSSSIALVEKEMVNNVTIKGTLMAQLNQLRGDYVQKGREALPLKNALKEGGVQYFAFLENPAINNLSARVADLTAEREKSMRDFLPASQKIKILDSNARMLYQSVKAEAQRVLDRQLNELSAIQERIKQTQTSIAQLDSANAKCQRQMVSLQQKARELDLWLSSYQTFTKRREEAVINSAITQKNFSADVSVLSGANYSAELIYPRKLMTLVLGLIVGFITGCSLGFLLEYLDHTMKRPGEVSRYTGLPVIGSIKKV